MGNENSCCTGRSNTERILMAAASTPTKACCGGVKPARKCTMGTCNSANCLTCNQKAFSTVNTDLLRHRPSSSHTPIQGRPSSSGAPRILQKPLAFSPGKPRVASSPARSQGPTNSEFPTNSGCYAGALGIGEELDELASQINSMATEEMKAFNALRAMESHLKMLKAAGQDIDPGLYDKFRQSEAGVHPHADARLDMFKYAVNLHAEDSDVHANSTLSRSTLRLTPHKSSIDMYNNDVGKSFMK